MESDLYKSLEKYFQTPHMDLRTYSPLTLAFIGDGIFDLVIRTVVVSKGNCPVNRLHRHTAHLVKAQSQARMMDVLEPLLTDEEADVFRRGRNARSATMAKNATVSDYRRATGLEALMGWLYLERKMDRLVELISLGLEMQNGDGYDK